MRIRSFLAAVIVAVVCILPAAPLPAQTASLAGTILSDPSEQPVANAEIVFAKLNISVRSDEKGNFLITGLPTGKQELIVRRIGYEPLFTTMNFALGQKVEADLMLKPVVTRLDKVNVTSAATRYSNRLRDFDARREAGIGKFLTADFFADKVGRSMSALISGNVTGLSTVGAGTKQVLVTNRGQSMNCRVQVIINGLVRYNGSPMQETFDVNSLNATDIIGLEYYTSSTTPMQFLGGGGSAGGSQCGTLVVWTK